MKKKISIRSTYVSLKVVDIRLQERIILKLCIVLLYKKKFKVLLQLDKYVFAH